MATFHKMLGHLLEPLLYIAPYPYLAFYPTFTSARHVRSVNLPASDGQTSGTMAQKTDTPLFDVMYPTKGILLWFIWSFSRKLAVPFAAKYLPAYLSKSIMMIVTAPVQLLWLHTILSDVPSSPNSAARYLRSITMMQWLQFIATILSFCLVEEIIDHAIDESLQSSVGNYNFSGDLDTSEARMMGRTVMVHYAISKAIKLFLWVPATVAAVQAVPDIHRGEPGQVTHEFLTSMFNCMRSMPLSLWYRCGIYYSIAAAISVLTKVVDGIFVVNVTLAIPGEKSLHLGDPNSLP